MGGRKAATHLFSPGGGAPPIPPRDNDKSQRGLREKETSAREILGVWCPRGRGHNSPQAADETRVTPVPSAHGAGPERADPAFPDGGFGSRDGPGWPLPLAVTVGDPGPGAARVHGANSAALSANCGPASASPALIDTGVGTYGSAAERAGG